MGYRILSLRSLRLSCCYVRMRLVVGAFSPPTLTVVGSVFLILFPSASFWSCLRLIFTLLRVCCSVVVCGVCWDVHHLMVNALGSEGTAKRFFSVTTVGFTVIVGMNGLL